MAPARVAKRAVEIVCEGIIRPHALGQRAQRYFNCLELIPGRRVCTRFAVA